MDENEVIRESDLIQLDGTIQKLILQLDSLNNAYASVADTIKRSAAETAKSLKSASGATREGRKAIDESAAAADRLEKAEKELAFAMSETGKEVAWLKAQTVDVNKATVAQQRQLEATVSSYDKIQGEVKELVSLYKSLTEAERQDVSFGGEIIAQIQSKSAQIKSLNETIKPHIQQLSALQKAEQKLAYLQSDEGKKLLEVNRQIRELTSTRKAEKVSVDAVTAAENKLKAAMLGEGLELTRLNLETQKQEKLNRLIAQEAMAQKGSYEQLSASYALAKAKLKELNLTLPENKEYVAALTQQLKSSYAAMRKFQESTGVYSLGVGAYKEAFTGLNFAVQQVVRELPSAAVSLNTFFLAISNNIPVLTDEIARETKAYKTQKQAILDSNLALDEQKKAITALDKPIKKIVKSLFSWQSGLVVLLTIFSMHGKAIIEWVGNLTMGTDALKIFTRALRNVHKEMKKTNGDFGESMIAMRKLRSEYSALETEAEKTEWIKDNKDEWEKLDIAMYSVADAERMFIQRTTDVKKAFILRAKAAAAQKLAAEQYEKMVPKYAKIEEIKEKGPEAYTTTTKTDIKGYTHTITAEEKMEADIRKIQGEIRVYEMLAESYYKIFEDSYDTQREILGEYKRDDFRKGLGFANERDFIEYIERMRVDVTKRSDEAISKMQASEFAKRRKEAITEYNKQTGDLKNTLAKNERILAEYYKNQKELTPEQESTIKTANVDIEMTLENLKKVYGKTMRDIDLDEQIFMREQAEKLVQIRLSTVKKGSDEEYALRKESVENQRKLELLRNKKLAKNEQQDEVAIEKKYGKQSADIDNEQKIDRLKVAQEQISLQLESVKEGSKEEYDLRKAAIKAQYEMEIAENVLLAEEEQQSEEDIRKKYNKQLEDLEYEHQMKMYDIAKKAIETRLGTVKGGSKEELDLMLEQIELERKAAIEANKNLAKELQQSQDEIEAYYDRRATITTAQYDLSSFRTSQTYTRIADTDKAKKSVGTGIKMGQEGSRKRAKYDLGMELADIDKQLGIADELGLSDAEIADLKAKRQEVQNEVDDLSGLKGAVSDIAKGGVAGGILGALGFNDEAIGAFNGAVDTIIENINAILEAEIEAAEKAVEAQQKRVDAAQAAYDAELEARNNGYANSVETARMELEEERKKEIEKQKILEDAQKKQEALNTIIQTSSLITAAAQIWSSMSSIPVVGPALAGAAIAAMFASFIVAKVKASQVTQQYGEGGIEFLEGGSHASGNDINLNTKNSKGKNMRAEGGEAIAIINKRNAAKYKKELPGIIDSINRGTFEDVYFKAFTDTSGQSFMLMQNNSIDLSSIEDDVKEIRRSNETKYASSDGITIVQYKNRRRIIKNN